MKTIKKIIALSLVFASLLIGACVKSTCEEVSTSTNTVYIFVDYTDQLNFNKLKENWAKDYKTINQLFPMQSCQGGKLRMIPVTNLGSNEIAAMSYEALPASLNEFNPPIDYTLFKRDFKKSMETFLLREAKELPSTHLFEPMCQAFNQLQTSTDAGRKIAIFYSDMLENSDGGSLYSKKVDPKVLLKQWQATTGCTLPDMTGLEVYIVNHRKERTNQLIRKSNLFWKDAFTKQGAKVVLTSSLEL